MGNKILIVDDDADMRRVVRGILEPLGQILEASNGKDALRAIVADMPELMLLDVGMPEMDGYDVLKAAHFLNPALPILMLTGETDLSMAKSALDDGARAYVTKPFDAVALRDEVRRLVVGAEGVGAASGGRPWSVRK
jgi:two-component system KDP operon response regulator KdpE